MPSPRHPLPLEVEQALVDLGARISLQRRLQGLRQADLARQMGVSLSTLTLLEQGASGVSIGNLGRALWALRRLEDLDDVGALEPSDELLEAGIDKAPKRVRRTSKG
nr:helix-turn-helix transcriptional regulator [Pseudomonas sp.]